MYDMPLQSICADAAGEGKYKPLLRKLLRNYVIDPIAYNDAAAEIRVRG